jgi:transcriptional regulator with PAS, ATPase and Fis domain
VKETRVNKISEDAMEALLNYDYPGSIRELENVLEHALTICQEKVIERRHLPLPLQKAISTKGPPEEPVEDPEALSQYSEKVRILEMLKRHNWHRGKTAQELHMDRTTLWRKMKKYQLSP